MSNIIKAEDYGVFDFAVEPFHKIHSLDKMDVGDVVVFIGKDTRSKEYLSTANWFLKNKMKCTGRTVDGDLHVMRIK